MKINKKNFYFVRHAEAIHSESSFYSEEIEDVPITAYGKEQALSIQKVIESLDIQTICVSPLLRARQTKEIIAQNLHCQEIVIDELTECSGAVWNRLITIEGEYQSESIHESTFHFIQRTINGINRALEYPGPVLIVAHGGIHWVMCHLMQLENHHRQIGNCIPIHFSITNDLWDAKRLI